MRTFLAILAALLALGAALPAGAAARDCTPLAPTLVSEIPSEVSATRTSTGRWGVAFRAGMTNQGTGPLTLVGRRPAAGEPMRSRQLLDCAGSGSVRPVKRIGGLGYSRRATHQHFHLRDIERYRLVALRDGASHSAVKRGFCLGDSYDTGLQLKHRPDAPSFDGDVGSACGAGRPGALRIREGISVGWGDYYFPLIEGQYVELTGLPAGDYRLLTELDPYERLVVGSRARAVGGVDMRLRWSGSTPELTLGGTCNTQRTCSSPFPAPAERTGLAALGRESAVGGQLAA